MALIQSWFHKVGDVLMRIAEWSRNSLVQEVSNANHADYRQGNFSNFFHNTHYQIIKDMPLKNI